MQAGEIDKHYFFQDLYMAKQIIKISPRQHHDIGSRIDGFISHLLCLRENITLIDIRPLPHMISGLKFHQSDATNLKTIPDNSIESISSLHAVEHFGLGRYGDPIDPIAWKKALLSMQRVLQENGYLYLSVPVGPSNKLCFNAHRIFDLKAIPSILSEMQLIKCAVVENYSIIEIPESDFATMRAEKDYSCGMYIFKKCKIPSNEHV